MKTTPYIFPALLLLTLLMSLSLTACGPKMVGEDTARADDGYTNPANEPEEQLRYPLGGSRTEQRLYVMNQPQLMVERQQKQREYFSRRLGIQENANPGGSDLFPRRHSPFR